MSKSQPEPAVGEVVAAVDLGSNSFHMVIARLNPPNIDILDRLKEPVRLALGLNKEGRIQAEAQARALNCLKRFGQRIADFHPKYVRVVGTNTLRKARRNNPRFIELAEEALGHGIDVIPGREEARLVYLGVVHGISDGGHKRLVVDIGGGSTELILGKGLKSGIGDSLSMGCVSYSQRFFKDGKISPRRMQEAVLAARAELQGVAHRYRQGEWERCIGSSGTIQAISRILRANGWGQDGITAEGLGHLRQDLLGHRRTNTLNIAGLKENRIPVICGGVAVLTAVFRSLDIARMVPSPWALREGVIFDLVGRLQEDDVRESSVTHFGERFGVDKSQASRVEATALTLLGQSINAIKVEAEPAARLLSWAARLHEVGMALSFGGYHRHGAYLITNSDLPGFSTGEQLRLAALVHGHRRRIRREDLSRLGPWGRSVVSRLIPILRLAVLLNRSRNLESLPEVKLDVDLPKFRLTFPKDYLDEHSLTRSDLEQEVEYLAELGVFLHFE